MFPLSLLYFRSSQLPSRGEQDVCYSRSANYCFNDYTLAYVMPTSHVLTESSRKGYWKKEQEGRGATADASQPSTPLRI